VIHTDDESSILSTIESLKCRLADFTDPDFGLLDELLRLQVLSRRQYAKVRSERTVYERNDALLDLLTTDDQCNKFLKALKRTSQQHVVNFIVQNGGRKRNLMSYRPTCQSNVLHLMSVDYHCSDIAQSATFSLLHY